MSVPEIRYKQYKNDWIERQFDAIISKSSQTSAASELPRVEYEDIVSGHGVLNKNIYDKSSNKKGLLFHSGDVLFGKLRPYLKNILLPDFSGIAVGDFWILQSDELSPHFVYNYVNTKHFQKIANTSIGTKMPRADWSLVSESKLYYPENPDEQNVIGNFLCKIERHIENCTLELDKLGKLKQASLQIMFPLDGETTPRIRFKGFIGEWKIASLGDCFEERQDRSGIGELLSVTMNDGIKQFKDLNRHDNSSANKSNYKVVHIGDIAYNSMRMWQGASGCSEYEGIVSPAYTVLVPNHGFNSRFFSYYFKNKALIQKFRINSQGLTSDTWNLKYPLFSRISLSYPENEEEQKEIADYFYYLNKEIKLKTDELERFKRIRTSCLNKMFVNPE